MEYKVKTVDEYMNMLDEDRKDAINKLRNAIKKGLPAGFSEEINYNMIAYVIPFDTYSKGYHRGGPLSLIAIGNQKNYIALYHLGIYGDPKLLEWFKDEYKKYGKLDMGKSCIRFKNINDIPYELITLLASKISVENFIKMYENR